MENNGKGIFYGVIGVATLIVAIIGATFAFFSASATVDGEDNIQGATNDQLGGALTASIEILDDRIYDLDEDDETNSTAISSGLIPLTDTMDATGIAAAVDKKCVAVNNSYMGCHLYQITASSNTDLSGATLTLDMDLTLKNEESTSAADWKYIIYQGTAANAPNVTETDDYMALTEKTFSEANDTLFNAPMSAGDEVVYYVLVYIDDDGTTQNDETTEIANNVLGTYGGTLTFTAAGGSEVSATFTAQG